MLGKKTSNRGRNPLVWLAPEQSNPQSRRRAEPRTAHRGPQMKIKTYYSCQTPNEIFCVHLVIPVADQVSSAGGLNRRLQVYLEVAEEAVVAAVAFTLPAEVGGPSRFGTRRGQSERYNMYFYFL